MMQPPIRNQQGIAAVEALGYTPHEAAFLALAALHGGYFLIRQFNQFVQIQNGKRAAALVARLIERRHARRLGFAYHRTVFHLRHRLLYTAIGEPESRNRREHQPSSIQSRLMALDYVLANPGSAFLATASDRLGYFQSLGIDDQAIPRGFVSKNTVRAFPQGFPIRLDGQLAVFSFIDSGFDTEAALITFLRSHRRLFEALPKFRLDFIGTRQSRFGRASAVFEQVLSKGKIPGADSATMGRLLSHFVDRRAFESRQTQGFDRARLDRLRDELDEFGSPAHQALFALFKSKGPDAVLHEVACKRAPRGTFRAVELPFVYGLSYQDKVA